MVPQSKTRKTQVPYVVQRSIGVIYSNNQRNKDMYQAEFEQWLKFKLF